MADIQKTIEIIFAGTDSNFSGTVGAAGDGIQSLSSDVNDLVGPLADVGKGILAFEAAAAAMTAEASRWTNVKLLTPISGADVESANCCPPDAVPSFT